MARAGIVLRVEIRIPVKMLLDLSEEHKEHLAFLPQVDSAGQGRGGRGWCSALWGGDRCRGAGGTSRSPGFRCSGRRVWANCGGVPEARLEPQDLRRRCE